jgi:hypothetical protein
VNLGRRRVSAALLTVLAAVAFVGCGSEGPSKAELAAQDRIVIAKMRKQDAHARIVAAVRAKNRAIRAQKRAASLRAQRARKRYRVIVREVPVVQSISVDPYDLCGPIRGGSPISKRERKRLRRQALYYLNLHC